ncbi:MAG: glutathione binding-like protein [Enterococcus sp.]
MIELYYHNTPNGNKIKIALEEMELEYQIKPIDISNNEQFDKDYLVISPNNKIPAIVDLDGPDGEPVSVFESGAILQYLGRKTKKFYPTNERQRIMVEEWLMWQVGGFGPMLGQNHHFRIYAKEKIDYAITRYADETTRLYNVLNTQLESRDYVAGEYSIADMAIITWVLSHNLHQIDLEDFPNVKNYMQRILARPAVQRALEGTR